MSTQEIKKLGDKTLKRQERNAAKRLAEIAALGDPGRGLVPAQAQAARDEQIQTARAAKAEAQTAKAELARRGREKQSYFARMWTSEATKKRREENKPNPVEAERKVFHDMLAEEQAKRNAEDLERRRAAGLIWEPVAPGGGDEVAAVFSSAFVWDAVTNQIRDGQHHQPTLDLRTIAHLWWSLNLISASGGSVTFPDQPARVPPHWPAYDLAIQDGIMYRSSCLTHLAKNGYITIERRANGMITLGYGKRTTALVKSYRDNISPK